MIVVLADVWVPGLPKTKGSLEIVSTKHVREAPGVQRWRALIAERVRTWRAWAHEARDMEPGPLWWSEPYGGPVHVSAAFLLPVDPLTVGAGDLDKLLRCALDAIGTESKTIKYNGAAIVNDNQVVSIDARKLGPSETPGLQLAVRQTI